MSYQATQKPPPTSRGFSFTLVAHQLFTVMSLDERDFSGVKSIIELQHGKPMEEAFNKLLKCFDGIEKKHQAYFDSLTLNDPEHTPVKLSDFYILEIPRHGGLNFSPKGNLRTDILEECKACIEAQLPK